MLTSFLYKPLKWFEIMVVRICIVRKTMPVAWPLTPVGCLPPIELNQCELNWVSVTGETIGNIGVVTKGVWIEKKIHNRKKIRIIVGIKRMDQNHCLCLCILFIYITLHFSATSIFFVSAWVIFSCWFSTPMCVCLCLCVGRGGSH